MYITEQDIRLPEEVLVRLTDDEGAGGPDYARVSEAIQSAQGVVDSALSVHYDVPLANPPELIKKLTRDITVRELYVRVGHVPDVVATAYEAASAMLAEISLGRLVPPGLDAPSGPRFDGQDRESTRGSMEGF